MSRNKTNSTVDPTQIYRVIIAARNNVERARNGKSVELNGMWEHGIITVLVHVHSFIHF